MRNLRFGCASGLPDMDDSKNHPVACTVEVIEGKELYETVCPVSKFTGHRESPFKLLGKLTGAKADLLNAVLQEIPSLASDPRLSDEDRVNTVVGRLSTGTPAEDSLMAERLMNDIDALGLRGNSVEQAKETIDFKPADSPDVGNVS